jgi:AraC-like DNA-binding protein
MKRLTDFVLSQPDAALADLPWIDMMGIQQIKAAQPRLPPHRNPGIEICYVFEGEFEWHLAGGSEVRIRSGEVSITRPWEEHGGKYGMLQKGILGWIIICLEKQIEGLPMRPGSWSRLADENGILAALGNDHNAFLGKMPELEEKLLSLRDELCHSMPGRQARVAGLCDDLLILTGRRLIRLAELPQSLDEIPRVISDIIQKLSCRPEHPWKLEQLVKRSGMSVPGFIDLFRETTGLTPKNFIIKARLEQAKTLLKNGDKTVTDLAMDLGFASPQHFDTIFKRYVGMTPSEWRSWVRKSKE